MRNPRPPLDLALNFLRPIACSAAVLLSCALFCANPPLAAQTPPDIQKLAARTAQRILQAGSTRVLAVPMSGCILDHQACSDFDVALQAALAPKVSGLEWIEGEKLWDTLKQHHFLELDAFFPEALAAVARDTGADILVTSDVTWEGTHYRLRIVIVDPATRMNLARFGATINDSQRKPSGRPFLLMDPDTGVAFILWNGDRRAAPLFKRPECDVCPEPPISVDALAKHLGGTVVILATITGTGAVGDLVMAKSANPVLDAPALSTVRGYIFKPALDIDGNPFAVRVEIDVNFPIGY
jgi:TonB family protein